jgi:SAM-dependent methyltransferase
MTQFSVPMKAAPPEWYSDLHEYYGWRWEFDCFLRDLDALRRTRGPLRILEIGCGEGIVLDKLSLNHEVCGIEVNIEAARIGISKGLNIKCLSLEDSNGCFGESHFDVIAFFQVLEHTEDPSAFLRIVKSLLRQDGHLFFSIPNPRRVQLLIHREQWDYPPHHLIRFTRAGVVTLLRQAGFSVLGCEDQPLPKDISRFRKHVYSNLPIPRRIKGLIKLPLMLALRTLDFYVSKARTGQDFYIRAAQNRVVTNKQSAVGTGDTNSSQCGGARS